MAEQAYQNSKTRMHTPDKQKQDIEHNYYVQGMEPIDS